MSAGTSRSRVTRIELTADQLLGSDLTPARQHRPSKNSPKPITIEQLLGTSLTIAAPAPRPRSSNSARSPSRTPIPRTRTPSRASTPRITLNPNRERVTADEVLRTGLPVRTLQAAKARARSGQALVLSAEQLLSSPASVSNSSLRSSTRSGSSSGRPRLLTAEELVGPGLGPSISRRPGSAGGTGLSGVGTSPSEGGSGGVRIARPSTAGGASSSGGGRDNGNHPTPVHSSTGQSRDGRPTQVQRSSSLRSTRTLPMYTKEPGESEVVIDRGAEELEDQRDDEIPITVMTPVDEDGPRVAGYSPDSTTPDQSRDLPHVDTPTAASPIAIPILGPSLTSQTPIIPHADEVPSYEAATMSLSTIDLHALPMNIPLPASPALGASALPVARSPSCLSTPASPLSRSGSTSPPSPTEGTESSRRHFGLRSLFHSRSRSRLRGATVSGPPSTVVTPPVPVPALPSDHLSPPSAPACPRPFHRSSHSASASMLDLLSRSWSENHMPRPRSNRGDSDA